MGEQEAGCLSVFMIILTIGAAVGSGILAWDWIEPDSFLSGVLFIIAWGVLSKIGHFIAMGIMMLITQLFE